MAMAASPSRDHFFDRFRRTQMLREGFFSPRSTLFAPARAHHRRTSNLNMAPDDFLKKKLDSIKRTLMAERLADPDVAQI
jgi:hypothetical protein